MTPAASGSHGDGRSSRPGTCIVAVPPVMASRIALCAGAAGAAVAALGAWHSGTVIKVQVRYARAFWRDRGLSGMVMWRDPHGLFACDTSSDDGHPALVVFVGGPLALRLASARRQTACERSSLARLTAALGPEAGEFTATSRRATGPTIRGAAAATATSSLDHRCTRRRKQVLRDGVPAGCSSPRRNCRRRFRAMSRARSSPARIAARKRRVQRSSGSAQSAIATSASGS